MSDQEVELGLSSPSKTDRIRCLDRLRTDTRVKTRVLDILSDIENVPATISDYRDKERHLENLLRALRDEEIIDSDFSQICAFHLLLGSLYINFEKFWGPTKRVIIDLLNQTKIKNNLLEKLLYHLRDTNDYIYDEKKRRNAAGDGSRPDHILHRNLVYQILLQFIDFVETHSQHFMNEFFLFVDKEIRSYPFIDVSATIDLTCSKSEMEQITGEDNVDDDAISFNAEAKPPTKLNRSSKKVKSRRFKLKPKKTSVSQAVIIRQKSRETFITASRILQSLSCIERVHRASELKQLILDLLCCRDMSIQRAAFNCLCAFNIDAIRLYRDTIRRILDVNQIRSELSVFSIKAEEVDRVPANHREQLIPIIQRIVFGRMINKVGKKTSGSDKAGKRKDSVMRFIAGCTEEEIHNFFKLLFSPLIGYFNLSYSDLEKRLIDDIDIRNYIPMNKMQAMLDTIESFMKFVGHLRNGLLPTCFRIINIIGHNVNMVLINQGLLSKISHKKVQLLKNVRRSCMTTLTNFFKTFEYYPFSQDEIDFCFKFLIWPSSQSFVDRNHASMTPILRLIEVFSHSRVYHNLLIKRNKDRPEEHLLDNVMSVYSDIKTNRTVIKSIGNMIADIINPDRSLPDEDNNLIDQSSRPPQLIDTDSRMPEYDSDLYHIPDDSLSENCRMLIRYIPLIFDRFSSTCKIFIEKKDIDYRFESSELLILSKFCGYLKDSQQCIVATKLILSTLDNLKNHDLIIETLKTARDLMKHTVGPIEPEIVSQLANTLYYQRNFEQRCELCNMLEVFSEVDDRLKIAYKSIKSMNCLSEDLLDTPDLVKWNEGFCIAFDYFDALDKSAMNDSAIIKNSINLLIHQVGFIINSGDRYEFSIRENCLIFYEKLSGKLKLVDKLEGRDFLTDILENGIMNKFIKKGLRNTNEVVKHLYLSIVRILAVNCPSQNKVLSELAMFCNTNQDLDFWLNIKHIQLHNRSKSLARLANDENLRKVSAKTLSSYFLPLVGGFLLNKNYKSLASLVENSIKIIGIICKSLTWNTYESILNYYLGLLTTNATYQRTTIKLITEIIKNFNFDITASAEAIENKEENDRLEQRMRKRLGPLGHELEGDQNQVNDRKKLNQSGAKYVYFTVTKKLIPRLNSCLHEMTRVEFEHDKRMADYMPEKDEIKRIPVAFAIVQLLNLLPCKYVLFRDHLPALFLKLISFMKSKNEQTRKAARATLTRIMKFVGPTYMPDLLRIMKQNLDKGFYIHVLNYTINSVLEKCSLSYGDLDSSCEVLMDICLQEIFGRPSEDKEIAQVIAKTSEAGKTKGYDTLLILASYISYEKLAQMISPLKDHLKTANDSRVVNKLSVCLQRVFTGLSQNVQFPLDKLLSFVRSTIEESIPSLRIRQKVTSVQASTLSVPIREDRYLIIENKSKDRIKSKINERGNLHMMVENSLRLLLLTFEKNKMPLKKNPELQRQLDDFIKLLAFCLKSTSPRCVMRALKCLFFIAQSRIDLPSFKAKCNSIVKKIFVLLSLYNGVGMAKGDNYEMIAMCFKTLTLLLLKCEHIELNPSQVRALMSYIEQDLNDASRQATAFKALHSLVLKKCESPELPEILDKVAEALVTSTDDNTRSYSIKIWQTYLLEYQLPADRLQAHLNKFLRQLDYEYIDGRRSVLKVLRAIVEKFPERILRDHFDLFFYLLSQRVINDEAKEVRDAISRLIALILQRLPDKQPFALNKFVLPWSNCDNPELNILGIKLISIFVEACPGQLENNKERITRTLAIIVKSLDIKSNDCGKKVEDKSAPTLDRLSYHSLRLFKRVLDRGLVGALENEYLDHLKKIWQLISRDKLCHSHEPVVLNSCLLYMHFITKTQVAHALESENFERDSYIGRNATKIVVTLCDKYIELLDRFDETSKIHYYVVQALTLLGKIVTNSRSSIEFEEQYINGFKDGDIARHLLSLDELPSDGFVKEKMLCSHNDSKKKGNLVWLSTKIIMQARKEAALYRLTKGHRRRFVLRWTAAVAQELGSRRIMPYAFLFMTTPARELTDKGKNKPSKESPEQNLMLLSEDLLKFLKSLLGVEVFNKMYAKAQLHYTKRRIDRKKSEAVLRVNNPAKGVKRKLAQRKENNRKKRKSMVLKKFKRLGEFRDIRQKKLRA